MHQSDARQNAPFQFYVGIATYCCFDLLAKAIEATLANTWLPDRIYVIDNSQGNLKRDMLPDSRRVQIFTPTHNLGAGGAWNFLLPAVHPFPIVMINDDTEPHPDLFEWMLNRHFENMNDVIVGDRGKAFTCMLMPQGPWKAVGQLDPVFWPAYYEDCDWAYRATLKGIKIIGPDAPKFHDNGPSATKARMNAADRNLVDRQYIANTDYYLRKWGGPPHAEKFPTPFNQPETPQP